MDDNLTNLADYSRQQLQVGTPPLNIYAKGGARPSQDIIQLSLMARIAEALEGGRIQLPTAVIQIQPRHADEFITLVAELVADRPGRVYIAAWHLVDEYVLHVTLAYERGESLFLIGRYWESMRGEQLSLVPKIELPKPVVFKISRASTAAIFRKAVEEFGKESPASLGQYAKVLHEDKEGRFEVEVSEIDDIFYLGLDFAYLQREGSQDHV